MLHRRPCELENTEFFSHLDGLIRRSATRTDSASMPYSSTRHQKLVPTQFSRKAVRSQAKMKPCFQDRRNRIDSRRQQPCWTHFLPRSSDHRLPCATKHAVDCICVLDSHVPHQPSASSDRRGNLLKPGHRRYRQSSAVNCPRTDRLELLPAVIHVGWTDSWQCSTRGRYPQMEAPQRPNILGTSDGEPRIHSRSSRQQWPA